jgi:carbon-monoxide dehydrogenase large subunit
LADVASQARAQGVDLSAEEMFTPGAQTFPYGADVAIVEVELETGQVGLLELAAVDDCGNVINPMVVEGQVHGSVMQGLGESLLEAIVYDDDGHLLTANLMTYLIPTAVPPVPLIARRLNHPAPSNPLGAKGTGETGCIGVPAAMLNAVYNALESYPVSGLSFPLTPNRVWQAIQDAGPRLEPSTTATARARS